MFKLFSYGILLCANVDAKKDEKSAPVKTGLGYWSEWSSWTGCSGSCGRTGLRHRDRTCSLKPCYGPQRQTLSCHLKGCSLKEYKDLVKSDEGRTDQLKVIEMYDQVHPSLTRRCVETQCSFQLVRQTLQDQADIFWSALHCLKHGSGCPVRGGWGEWLEWSRCSALCGPGMQVSCRSCDDPKPSNQRFGCVGSNCTRKPCSGEKCILVQGKVWGEWSSWSGCSQTCGQGFRSRRRLCFTASPSLLKARAKLSRSGRGFVRPERTENERWKRSVDEHNVEPRQGNSGHLLEMINDSPPTMTDFNMNVARICLGSFEQLTPCYLTQCPGEGGWCEWTEWSECSRVCGLGQRVRSRACSSPPPSPPTNLCHGSRTETASCFNNPCSESFHEVAVFTGEGMLSCSVLGDSGQVPYLHFMVRFKSSTPDGRIFTWPGRSKGRRVSLYIKNSLVGFQVDKLPHSFSVISNYTIQLKTWHRILLMMTPSSMMMRLNDQDHHTAMPISPRLGSDILANHLYIGEAFFGQMQRLVINFKPVALTEATPNVGPSLESGLETFLYNVDFDLADIEETFVSLANLWLVPCPPTTDWTIEFALKSELYDGDILLMKDWNNFNYLLLSLEESRVVVQLNYDQQVLEQVILVELRGRHWIQIKVGVEARELVLAFNGGSTKSIPLPKEIFNQPICDDHLFVGDITHVLKELRNETSKPVGGVLGYLKINGANLDLQSLPFITSDSPQFLSSSYLSTPESFHQIKIKGNDKSAQLKCPFKRQPSDNNQFTVSWFKFDEIISISQDNVVSPEYLSFDVETSYDSSVLKMRFKNSDSAEGFYSCQVKQRQQDLGVMQHMFVLFRQDTANDRRKYLILLNLHYYGTIVLIGFTLIWCLIETVLHCAYPKVMYKLKRNVSSNLVSKRL